uniref:uncharacterized protein isoform X2 n=1 Tax=Semicossyphus pulcher TaxID=241346 RepID=UPI0037E92C8A
MKVPVMMASYLSHTQQGESSADNAEVPAGHAQGDSGVAAPFGRPGPIDIYLQSRAAGPTQPRLKMYPKTMQGKKRRSFNPSWYNMFSWLEYSPMKDSAYCYAYRQFSLPSTSESVFTLEKSKCPTGATPIKNVWTRPCSPCVQISIPPAPSSRTSTSATQPASDSDLWNL